MSDENKIEITVHELPFVKALLDAATVHLQQAQILTRNEIFRPGALLTVEELSPAVKWLQLIAKQLRAQAGKDTA